MFEFIRTHSRLTLGLLLLLIIPSFVFFGFENYSSFTDGTNAAVAEVDGRKITRAEWDLAHQRNVERVRRQNPQIDAQTLDTPAARRETLDGLVRERVLLAAANQLHLAPPDARLQRLFVTDPQFAQLRNPDGTVNRELLAAQGMTSERFVQSLRQDFAVQQVVTGLSRSVLLPPSVAGSALDALLQRREVQLQRFDPAAYRAQVSPSEADLEAFHKANEADFRAPEQADIEYVVLDLQALARDVAVPEDDLRKYYAENASRYTAAEERRASHILVKADAAMSSADKQKAKARAEALLAEVRKAPASFAEVARKNSEDEGSKAQGGDLDWFGRGGMVKPFEDAVYAMKSGEISSVIESEFGYHVITLTGVRGGEKKPFEAVRAEIEAEVRRSLAQRRYAEAAEQFTNLVYEQADSLQPAVDKLKLLKQTATVQRNPLPGATGVLASPKLLQAVFGNDVVNNKRNTDAVETGPNQLAAARIVKHNPARTRPLAEVKDEVRERLIARDSARLARAEGEKRVAAVRADATQVLPMTMVLSRQQSQGAPRQLVDAALGADASKLPAVSGVDLGLQGYMVLRVTKVLPREPLPGGDAPLQAQLAQAWTGAETEIYLQALNKRFKAEVKAAADVAPAADAASVPVR
jgi:peptidyl-prolyl cis-trans isomerase D